MTETLEGINIIIGANTQALDRAVVSIDKLTKAHTLSQTKITGASRKIESSYKALDKAMMRQVTTQQKVVKSTRDSIVSDLRREKTLNRGKEKVEELRASLLRMGGTKDQINVLNRSLGTFSSSLKSAKLSSDGLGRAQEGLRTRLIPAQRALKDLNRTARENNMKKAARDTKKFTEATQELTKSIQIALGPLSGVASRVTAMSALLSSGAIKFALTAGAIIGFSVALIKTVNVGKEFEAEMLRIEAILKATGRQAEITSKEVEDIAFELGKATLTSAGEARKAAAIVLAFSKISSSSLQEVLDRSQDLAAVMGGTLQSSARQLGRALQDPAQSLDSLRRAGIVFSESEKKLLKNLVDVGLAADAQRIVLDKLNETIGGAARKEAEGLAGALDTLGESFRLFLETAAGVVLPDVTIFISNLSKTIEDWATNTKTATRVGEAFRTTIQIINGIVVILSKTFSLIAESPVGKLFGIIADSLERAGNMANKALAPTKFLVQRVNELTAASSAQEDLFLRSEGEKKKLHLAALLRFETEKEEILKILSLREKEEIAIKKAADERLKSRGSDGRANKDPFPSPGQNFINDFDDYNKILEKTNLSLAKARMSIEKEVVAMDLKAIAIENLTHDITAFAALEAKIIKDADKKAQDLKTEIRLINDKAEAISRSTHDISVFLFLEEKIGKDQQKKHDDLQKEIDLINKKAEAIEKATMSISEFGDFEKEVLKTYNRDLDIARRNTAAFADIVSDAFARGVMEGRNFSEIIRDITRSIAQMLLKAALMKAIMGGFGFPSNPTIPIPQTAPSGVATAAHGGLIPGNRPTLVGEKGMELFVPRSSGTIIPNNQLGMGGQPININVINNNNADISIEETRNGQGGIDLDVIVGKAVSDDLRTNGIAFNAIRETFRTNRRMTIR